MASVWDSVVGQDRAVDQLRHAVINPVHAFLLVGVEGCGSEEAARACASFLLSGDENPADRVNEMAMRGAHPDVHEFRRAGASILTDEAEEIVRIASTTPSEASRLSLIHI